MGTAIHNNDRPDSHPHSDIWHVVLVTFAKRNEKLYPGDIAAATETKLRTVRRRLDEMSTQGWVDWPADEDGAVKPGEKATKFLDNWFDD